MIPWEPNLTPDCRPLLSSGTNSDRGAYDLARTYLKFADLQDNMKRAQDLSSSDSELDDSTEVEKESTEENEYARFFLLFDSHET